MSVIAKELALESNQEGRGLKRKKKESPGVEAPSSSSKAGAMCLAVLLGRRVSGDEIH